MASRRSWVQVPPGPPMAIKKVFLTGLRPTAADLQLGNYLGAVGDILEIQKKKAPFFLFIADLHALTTDRPKVVAANRQKIAITILAAGIDPQRVIIYCQSALAQETLELEIFLSRHFTVAQALRVPTLKEKMRRPEQASLFLLRYPTLMAADILLQRATHIPVGKDQAAHLEVSRLLAQKFNRRYGQIFPIPRPYQTEGVKLMSLDGQGKMSKSHPQGAIFLGDNPETVRRKIRHAVTEVLDGPREKMNENVASLFLMARSFADETEKEKLKTMEREYYQGRLKFVHLKELAAGAVGRFLAEFQVQRAGWQKKTKLVADILEHGSQRARRHARETMDLVAGKTGFRPCAAMPNSQT